MQSVCCRVLINVICADKSVNIGFCLIFVFAKYSVLRQIIHPEPYAEVFSCIVRRLPEDYSGEIPDKWVCVPVNCFVLLVG